VLVVAQPEAALPFFVHPLNHGVADMVFRNAGVALLALVVLLSPGAARADLWGADLAPLTTLMMNSFTQLQQMAESIKTAREQYELIREGVRTAREAEEAFGAFQKSGLALFSGDVDSALASAFPDYAYWRGEAGAVAAGRWAEPQGRLVATMRMCVGTGGRCKEVQDVLSIAESSAVISSTFGTKPLHQGHAFLDDQAAITISRSSSQEARSAVMQAQAQQLREECLATSKIEVCQSAAALAATLTAEATAEQNTLAAEQNRLTALQLAQGNEQMKRDERAARERQLLLESAARRFVPGETAIEVEGFNLVGSGR